MSLVPPLPPPLDSHLRGIDEVRWWSAGGGLPHPAQGAHKGHPYGRLGKWWDAGRFFHRLGVLPLPTPLDSGLRRNDEWGAGLTKWGAGVANERLPERSIPDRGPGHAFIGIAHAGWGRHTKV